MENPLRSMSTRTLSIVFVALVIWWVTIFARGLEENTENYLFSLLYTVMPIGWGALALLRSKQWGGLRSSMGRAVIFFSLALIGWGIGNLIYAYYNLVLLVPVPYPSIADFGFYLLYPLSALGLISLFRATGASVALKGGHGKLLFLLIPLGLAALSYYLLLVVARGGVIEYQGDLLKFALDVAYPVGDLVVLTLAAMLFMLSYRYLGGIFKRPVLVLIAGFVLSYITDFLFAYTTTTGTFFVGNWVELLFATTFFVLCFGLTTVSSNALKSVVAKSASVTSSFSDIALRIIKEQERVIGPLAWNEARRVAGIEIDAASGTLHISETEGMVVIDRLVAQYERLFGRASQEVCREAAAPVLARLAPADIPLSLRAA